MGGEINVAYQFVGTIDWQKKMTLGHKFISGRTQGAGSYSYIMNTLPRNTRRPLLRWVVG